jgi:hypothetical protein
MHRRGAHIADVSRATAILRETPEFQATEAGSCARCAQTKPLTAAAA